MCFDSESYRKFASCIYELRKISFMYRVLINADLSEKDWNSPAMYDTLHHFSERMEEISGTLSALDDKYGFDIEYKNVFGKEPDFETEAQKLEDIEKNLEILKAFDKERKDKQALREAVQRLLHIKDPAAEEDFLGDEDPDRDLEEEILFADENLLDDPDKKEN